MSALDAAEAEAAVSVSLAAAADAHLEVTVAVADAAGGLIVLRRTDGCARLATITVQRKIATVLATGTATIDLADSLAANSRDEPGLLISMVVTGMFAVAGGVPLLRRGEMVGVIAVSGASSADDHRLAEIGAALF